MFHEPTGNGEPGPYPFGLHHDAWGQLVLTEPAGRRHVGVTPVRAFPLSDPEHGGIALCDAEGHEVAWVECLDRLPAPLRRVLEEDLARREFVPVLRRIRKVSAAVEPSEWEVDTDRGPTRFLLAREEDVHRLDGRRALVTDAHGLRYLIPDVAALDAASRRFLERLL
jgi:hypothetical protein